MRMGLRRWLRLTNSLLRLISTKGQSALRLGHGHIWRTQALQSAPLSAPSSCTCFTLALVSRFSSQDTQGVSRILNVASNYSLARLPCRYSLTHALNDGRLMLSS
eukprot:PhF_6_TR8473/c0_g1_i2/m.13246